MRRLVAEEAGTLRCDAVLFDLDGVLVDSRSSIERHWGRWADANRVERSALARATHGRRTVDTVRALAPHLDAEAEARGIERAQAEDRDLLAIPGARSLFAAIPEHRRAVVTSGSRALALARLAAGGLGAPRVLVAAEDVAQGKPHPEGYQRAARALGWAAAACVVVEDAEAGFEAASAAGMRVIAVSGAPHPGWVRRAEAVVPDLSPLSARCDLHGVALWFH